MNVTILGAGAWGTALAKLLHESGNTVSLWVFEPHCLEQIRDTGRNEMFLPGIDLPRDWRLHLDPAPAVADADLVVAAVPSNPFRKAVACLAGFSGGIVTVTKGIEQKSGLTMTGVLRQIAPRARIACLSGPTLALEVARGIPTAIVAASDSPELAVQVQELFHRPSFRVYTSDDVLGVELGGALKNVMAIAAGVCDGLGFGDNSKAALITRGIAEMRRLGVACGAQPDTFAGLSGIGDLTVTCFSKLSRNRGFGERIGRGEKPDAILAQRNSVAEGYPTAQAAFALARRLNIDTPIIDEVYAMLYENKDAQRALQDLTTRSSKAED
jgi:glycerol-3-phosphate dehydrogenase (NAD(P)+)